MQRKTIFLLVLLTLLLTCVCATAQAQSTTVLMYMCGTDLQGDCVQDMYEMSRVTDMPDEVQVVVQAGGASQWDDGDLTPNDINRFVIHDQQWLNMETIGHASMGAQSTLYDFLDWGVASYPADRYMLVLWNHGGGSAAGVCFDETANDDSLSIHEINDALYEYVQAYPGFRLDVIGCDACLMATYEMAAHMSGYANYLVASEELEPGTGWEYTGWLTALCENPDIDTQSMCVSVADSFLKAGIAENPNDYLSLSVTYLPAMQPLIEVMETYSAYLCEALDNGQLATISRARQRMYAFGSFADSATDMVDFMAFLDATRQFAPNTAAKVEAAYKKAVRYSIGTDMFDYLTGLSILMPMDENTDLTEYSCEECIPAYSQFAVGMQALLRGGDYAFDVQKPAQLDSETASQAVFGGNLQSTIFVPGGSFVAAEDAAEPTDTDGTEDVTADLPEVESSVEDIEGVTVGSVTSNTFLTNVGPEQLFGQTEETPEQQSAYAWSITLDADALANLGTVEGMLFMDISDEENGEAYVSLGGMQNAGIDWQTGEIVSNFDGSWAILNEEQLVVLYDQVYTQSLRRSIIPVKRNDEEGYLLVVFNAAHPDGIVTGFTKGTYENGMPVRGSERLAEGDVLVPLYKLMYPDENGEMQEASFEGDPITVGADTALSLSFESLEGTETNYTYCFRLTDIFGNSQLSEMIPFAL